MKLIICVMNILLAGILLFNAASVSGNEDNKKNPLEVTLRVINEFDLKEILKKHEKWLKKQEGGQQANLSRADLTGVDLSGIDLTRADMNHVKLSEAKLIEAKLRGTDLSGADLSFADLRWADMSGANLFWANLAWANLAWANLSEAKLNGTNLSLTYLFEANLKEANLSGAYLSQANLSGARLIGANLSRAKMTGTIINGADFSYSTFEPESTDGLVFLGAKGFSRIKFKKTDPVVTLRKKVKEAGFRYLEKQLTAALHKHRRQGTTFEYIFLHLPTDFGANPWRSFLVFGAFLLFFSTLYTLSLEMKGRDGIWIEWAPGRLRKDLGEEKPARLLPSGFWSVVWHGLYFSVLSAFHIGWKDLNVGSWIVRLQYREYVLRATGRIRFVSGVQSLISIYLLALWALTYFGRPFD